MLLLATPAHRSGMTWISVGIHPIMAALKIYAYRRIGYGNRMCWCTTALTRVSMAHIKRMWWYAITVRAYMCRRVYSSLHAKSTSRGFRSMISAAKWNSAVGHTMDFRFESVVKQLNPVAHKHTQTYTHIHTHININNCKHMTLNRSEL